VNAPHSCARTAKPITRADAMREVSTIRMTDNHTHREIRLVKFYSKPSAEVRGEAVELEPFCLHEDGSLYLPGQTAREALRDLNEGEATFMRVEEYGKNNLPPFNESVHVSTWYRIVD